MPIILDVPTEALIPRGEYRAKITQIGEPEPSKFDPEKKSLKLIFEITEVKAQGQKLSKWYTCSLASKSSLGQLFRRLNGEPKSKTVDLERQ